MREIKELKDLEYDGLIIKWRITYDCNYQCSYCIQNICNKENMDFDILQTAEKIENLIQRSDFEKTELMLIGGEVSLLNLEEVMSKLPSVTRLHITTNLSAKTEYYNSLAKKVPLKLCASFHDEYISVDEFIEKFKQIECEYKCVETVLNKDTENLVNELVAKCKEKGFNYIIDSDRTEQNRTQIESDSRDRIEITFTDGTVKRFKNKNDMKNDSDMPYSYSKSTYFLKTGGMTCSRGYDYLYIRGDVLIGGNGFCMNKMKIDDWKPMYSECSANSSCSFCGAMSIRRKDEKN